MIPSSPLDSNPALVAGSGIAYQAERLFADFNLRPITAAEIEFYLIGAASCPSLPAFWEEVTARCGGEGIALYKTDKESGDEQYEIALTPSADPGKTANDVRALKRIVTAAAAAHGMKADFSAKPVAGQPGSGLHIHTHLADARGKNVFYKRDAVLSDALKFSLGGLLATLREAMPIFAPAPESYARFTPGSNAPLTVSWGANNRTAALRLPDSEHDNKRIEHRVAGADADPERVIAAILAGIHYGLTHRCDPGPQIHGDASLPMYDLPRLAAPPPYP